MSATATFSVELPHVREPLTQDEEYIILRPGDGSPPRRIRIHDYHEVFEVQGLYERLYRDMFRCDSPRVVTRLLEAEVAAAGRSLRDLAVLDLGAGNGMVGEELHEHGARALVGIDILPEARAAANRDRPGLYADYAVTDLTQPSPAVMERLGSYDLGALVQVAGLGFGDIPPLAFATAFNLISTPGWVAFNIKEDFLRPGDDTGFRRLMRRMEAEGVVKMRVQERYRHRMSVRGEPLHYMAIVSEKFRDVPMDWPEVLA